MGYRRAIAWGVGLTLAALGSLLAGDLAPLVLPGIVRDHPVEWGVAGVAIGRLLVERRRGDDPRAARVLGWIDDASARAIRRGLFVALAGLAATWLAGWLPHYPFWPWGRDLDTYAEIAKAWDGGVRPYRDIRAFNFPGHIYLHWTLGKAFGWGRPGLLYVADAAALLALGGLLLAWSRRRLGGPLPGMAAYLIFLTAYLDMHHELVAQRDWHAALGATAAILTLLTWPGRRARWASALAMAAGLAIRPHLVLFLPAVGLAAMHDPGDPPGPVPARRRAARVAEWACAFGLFTAAAFAPLLFAGVLDDLVRCIRTTRPGGAYSTFTRARGLAILLEELRRPVTATLLAALSALAVRGPLKVEARTWLAALLGVLAYRPLAPVAHEYLKIPLVLVEATASALPIAWCARASTAEGASRRAPFLGLLAILLLLYEALPMRPPSNHSFPAAIDAIRAAARSGRPGVPPGAWVAFSPANSPRYGWEDYNRLLDYLRESTEPGTVVANVLRSPPFPPVNGTTGRRSPFLIESGVPWMWVVREDLDGRFARELEAAGPDSVVVWSPDEVPSGSLLGLPRLIEVVRRDYAPEARFGAMEVWRRKPGDAPAPVPSSPAPGAGDPSPGA